MQIAEKVAETEMEVSSLTISAQVKVRKFADDLKMISENMRAGAHYSAITYGKLSQAAMNALKKVNLENPGELDADAVKMAAVLQATANHAASIPMSLMAANKDDLPRDTKPKPNVRDMSNAELAALEKAAKILQKSQGE
jgi:hypothetical protein